MITTKSSWIPKHFPHHNQVCVFCFPSKPLPSSCKLYVTTLTIIRNMQQQQQQQQQQKQQEDIIHTLIIASFSIHNNFLSISYTSKGRCRFTTTQNTSIWMHNLIKIWLVIQVMYKTFSKYSPLHWSLIYDHAPKNLEQSINTFIAMEDRSNKQHKSTM